MQVDKQILHPKLLNKMLAIVFKNKPFAWENLLGSMMMIGCTVVWWLASQQEGS